MLKEAGGVGLILVDEADKDVAIPSAIVGKEIGNKILTYINHTRKPISKIFPAKTVLGSQPALRVAAFSSKGPNALTPEILKPDFSAPGLNILTAWSPADGKMQYNILSGTSMACPHVTGIATLIKAVHPSWSPSAIKYAVMTTASIIDKNYKPITVDPKRKRVPDLKDNFSVTQTVTNVGKPRSIYYKALVSPPIGINVTIVPKQLIFNRYGQKIQYVFLQSHECRLEPGKQ